MIYPWQHEQWQLFCQQKNKQRLPHAMLLTGQDGLGKLSIANQMVAAVLCKDDTQAEPCGHCHSCQLFAAGNHPDHTFITPEESGKQIKIDQIRQLKEKQELTPTVANWKTVIISPSENMNISSNNSLLKLLEEPQTNTLLILITARQERLPITILSRCQKVVLSAPEQSVTLNWLQQQGTFDARQIEQIMPLAKGAPLRLLELIKSNIIEQIQVVETDFNTMLTGKANPITIAKNWQQYDLMLGFNYLQNLIKQRLLTKSEQGNNEITRRYWHIYDCILATIKLLSSSNNINKTLLIEQFMVSVMDDNWADNSSINF